LDLSLTETKTGRIVANVPLQKQIVSSESRFNLARFFGDVLIEVDVGNSYREPLQYAVRQMLNLATFELLAQVMSPESYADCREAISEAHGNLENSKSARKANNFLAKNLADKGEISNAEEGQDPKPRIKNI
jgi:curli biogenesis system outer membrane secretion channel CsgG